MKKLIALVILCAALMGTTVVVDPNRPLTSFYANMTCDQATEMYDEAALLFNVAGQRLDAVKQPQSKFLWQNIRLMMMNLHDQLLLRREQVCKEA